jgi:phenylpropionate dioxygenase-like ring-hydroxylating dioxygenase large terminal subunit
MVSRIKLALAAYAHRALKQRGGGIMNGNLLDGIKRVWAGYPGGYKKWARGSQPKWAAAPFQQPTDPNDLRSKIPPLGHREYWYPALPDRDVKKKPQVLRMLGEDLVFFRGKDGEVKALKDACPHRGAYLSLGDCFYKGFITCPYHGATFDGDGNCVAFLTEGPDSKMVGQMKAWPRQTVTLKGVVFVWMGEGEPVDPREDIPPELFDEPHTILRWACQVVPCNWILVLENTNDAHNCFFVHRNCISILKSRLGGRPRTPLGYRTKILNGKTANYSVGSGIAPTERYYYDENGHIPYQMYYPGVDGVWPLTRWRLLWTWIWDRKAKNRSDERWGDSRRNANMGTARGDDDWQGTRLPSISAKGTGGNAKFRSHRWAVPAERDLTRVVYLNIERYMEKPSLFTRVYKACTWPWRNWVFNFNFRYADVDAERTCQYHLPEYLSATDSTVVMIRKVLAEHARGIKTSDAVEPETPAEEHVTALNVEAVNTAQSVHAADIKEGLAKTGYPGIQ